MEARIEIPARVNLAFYLWLMAEARKHIISGDFLSWKNAMVEKLDRKLYNPEKMNHKKLGKVVKIKDAQTHGKM